MTTPNPRVPNPFLGASSLSRRQLIKRAGFLGAAGLSLPAFLAACGGSSDDDASSGTSATGSSPGTAAASGSSPGGGGGDSLYFENWPAYIDPTEDGLTGTVDRFVAATGIDMKYTEAYNDNNEYFAKIQPVLGNGDTIDPDIIAPTSWLTGRLIHRIGIHAARARRHGDAGVVRRPAGAPRHGGRARRAGGPFPDVRSWTASAQSTSSSLGRCCSAASPPCTSSPSSRR